MPANEVHWEKGGPMKQARTAASIAALLIAGASSTVSGQVPDYGQAAGSGSAADNPNAQLSLNALTPAMRVPVKTTVGAPLRYVRFVGYRDMVCARQRASTDPGSGMTTGVGGQLDLRERLLQKLAALDVAGMRAVLQRAEQAADRASQYQELFGAALPPSSARFGELDGGTGADPAVMALTLEEKQRLNTGGSLTIQGAARLNPDSGQVNSFPDFVCLTLPQVDAAIAEAKRVYQAVIAAATLQQKLTK